MLFTKIEVKSCPKAKDSSCHEILLPKCLSVQQQKELKDEIDGHRTDNVLGLLEDKIYDLNMALATQRMSSQRKKILDSTYTFLIDLYYLCEDYSGFVYVE